MDRSFFEVGLLVLIFIWPGTVLLLIAHHCYSWTERVSADFVFVCAWGFAGLGAYLYTADGHAFGMALIGAAVSKCVQAVSKDYYSAGHIVWAATALSLPIGAGWGIAFILGQPLSWFTQCLFFALFFFIMMVLAPLRLLTMLQSHAYLFRKVWHRPRHALPPVNCRVYPKVSLHVPCYAEPPDVVCATLNALNGLDYPDFEVLVVDNNTRDPSLWKPVQAHCKKLGPRFRFFHVDPLQGAKAGALNYALDRTAADALIIGVIDADYQARPDYIQCMIGFFDDPAIGFVQTPHDYRQWASSPFQRSCYWEYRPSVRLRIACLNEWSASYIIGTMCLIRRSALEAAGGWAPWCLTEDSECAIRIHALGYQSVYVTRTAGRGLIPESFHEYKKQRFRWTVGPIQQFKRHWRLYLPGPLAKPSRLTGWQRLLEVSHSLQELSLMLAAILLPFQMATLARMIYKNEFVAVPSVVWMALAVTLPSLLAIRWLTYRLAGCACVGDMIRGTVATLSLTYIRLIGAFIGCSSKNGIAWRRTCKFHKPPDKFTALHGVRAESLLALCFFLLSAGFGVKASMAPPDLIFLSSMGLFGIGLVFLCAPVMALSAEYRPLDKREKEHAGQWPGKPRLTHL